jgi:hypothetical protein
MRQITGIPGATVVGRPVAGGPDFADAVMSGRGDYAIVVASDSGLPGLWTSLDGIRKLPGVEAAPARIVLSPEGTAVALYYAESRRVQIVTGLPLSPSRPREYSLAPLRSPMRSLAVSDDGQMFLCAEDGPAVVAMSAAGGVNRILLSGPATALAFAPKRHDAVIVTSGEASLVSDPVGAAEKRTLPDTLANATAATFSSDGGRIYFTDARAGRVAVYQTGAESANTVLLRCECQPAGLYRMGEQETYRLTEYAGRALWILDAETTPPRIVSAPPAGAALDKEQ